MMLRKTFKRIGGIPQFSGGIPQFPLKNGGKGRQAFPIGFW